MPTFSRFGLFIPLTPAARAFEQATGEPLPGRSRGVGGHAEEANEKSPSRREKGREAQSSRNSSRGTTRDSGHRAYVYIRLNKSPCSIRYRGGQTIKT